MTALRHFNMKKTSTTSDLINESEILGDVLNSLSSHIAIIDENGFIAAVNKAWKIFSVTNGVNPENYGTGINYLDISNQVSGPYAEHGNRFSVALKEVLSGNMKYFSMIYPCHSSTELIWFKAVITPLQSNLISGAVISHRDMTEKILAKEELKKNETKFQSLFEQASDAIFIADENFKIININVAACNQLGYTECELQNMQIHDLFFETDLAKEPIKINELNRGENIINERRFKRKDGSALDVEINSKKLPNGFFQGISRDITERKQNELLIKKKENYIRTILNTDPECIKMVNAEGICLTMNQAGLEILETDWESDVIGQNILKVVNPGFQKAVADLVKNSFEGKPGKIEYQITTFKGNTKWLEGQIVPFKNTEGIIESCLWISRDISDRVKDREALQKYNSRLKKNFSKVQEIIEKERKEISRELHDELGQKLTALNLDIAWLQKRIAPELTEEKDLMNEMMSLVDSLMKTVQDISKNLRPQILEKFNLQDAVTWLVAEFEKRSKIKCKVHMQIGNINLTEALKVTVFRTLQESLTNINRHSNASKVELEVFENGDQLTLSVTDDGKGITHDEINDVNSLGIHGMQERIESLNGTFKITGLSGKGTNLLSTIPLP
ncbi:MAG: PAS domain S-box protein [Bacteroidetes bacterium]|nr:MAG: PAS domain S-box protein [Bacteroidota bacterium]